MNSTVHLYSSSEKTQPFKLSPYISIFNWHIEISWMINQFHNFLWYFLQDPEPTHPAQSLITFFLCGWFITGYNILVFVQGCIFFINQVGLLSHFFPSFSIPMWWKGRGWSERNRRIFINAPWSKPYSVKVTSFYRSHIIIFKVGNVFDINCLFFINFHKVNCSLT